MVVRTVTTDNLAAQERRLLIELLAERLGTTPEWVRSEGLPRLLQLARSEALSLEAAVGYLRRMARPGFEPPVHPQDEPEDEDVATFVRLLPELRRKYPGKYIAMDGGKVVAVGNTPREAARLASERTGRVTSYFVRGVEEGAPEVEEVYLRLGRPREVVSKE